MNGKMLITPDDIRGIRAIAADIPNERLLVHIKETQELELKQLLGDALYHDFITKFDISTDPMYTNYQNLLRGVNYPYSTLTIRHPGLVEYLTYFTLAKFYLEQQINVTKFGITVKKDDKSDSAPQSAINNIVASFRSYAIAKQADIVKYLTTMGSLYPLYYYQRGDQLGQIGVKFFDPQQDRPRGQYNGRTLTSF